MPLPVRLALALVAMATVLGLLNLLIFRRAAAAFGLSARARRILVAALGVPFVLTVLFRGLGPYLPVGFASPLAVAASSFEMGVAIAGGLLMVALGARGLARGAQRLAGRAGAAAKSEAVATSEGAANGETAAKSEEAPALAAPTASRDGEERHADAAREEAPPPKKTSETEGSGLVARRQFVEQAIAGTALVAGGASAGYGGLFGRHDYQMPTVAVPIPGLSKAADGFTIVQLSDIHLGQMVGEGEMRAAEELVRQAKGDLIVLTGDLIDHDPRYCERLGRLARRFRDIRPVVAIPGNHEYYTGVDEVLETLRKAGATVLVNESITLLGDEGGFVLAGLDDGRGMARGGGPDLELALANVRSEAPRIVLCHNPKEFYWTAGQCALQLSGHTHGGQVKLGVSLAEMVLRHDWIAGLYEQDGSRLYVNRGFGTAGPAVRVGAPPEVTRIVLVSA